MSEEISPTRNRSEDNPSQPAAVHAQGDMTLEELERIRQRARKILPASESKIYLVPITPLSAEAEEQARKAGKAIVENGEQLRALHDLIRAEQQFSAP